MIKTTDGTTLDGWSLLNDAYAVFVTNRGAENGWVPSNELDEYEATEATATTARDLGGTEYTHALIEMIFDGGLENDPVFEEIEKAAARALMAFAREMDEEARQQGLLEDDDC